MMERVPAYRSIGRFLADAVRGRVIPIVYLDTNVVLDIVDRRDPDSLAVYRYAQQMGWNCVTSVFTKVEVLEVKQWDRFRREKRKLGWRANRIKKWRPKRDLPPRVLGAISRAVTMRLRSRFAVFEKYPCIAEGGWEIAEDIKRKTNLTDKDSIQLAEARAIACDLFVTQEKFLLAVAGRYLWSERPRDLRARLRSAGAQI